MGAHEYGSYNWSRSIRRVLLYLYIKKTMTINLPVQDPFLFSTTIRDNLDPHEQYDDEDIWVSVYYFDTIIHYGLCRDVFMGPQ